MLMKKKAPISKAMKRAQEQWRALHRITKFQFDLPVSEHHELTAIIKKVGFSTRVSTLKIFRHYRETVLRWKV